jgi:hypothetical protein
MLLCQKQNYVKRKPDPELEECSGKPGYCGSGFFPGDPLLTGNVLSVGSAFVAGDPFGEAESPGVAAEVVTGAGFRTGTVADATICHWPLRRTKVSILRN